MKILIKQSVCHFLNFVTIIMNTIQHASKLLHFFTKFTDSVLGAVGFALSFARYLFAMVHAAFTQGCQEETSPHCGNCYTASSVLCFSQCSVYSACSQNHA